MSSFISVCRSVDNLLDCFNKVCLFCVFFAVKVDRLCHGRIKPNLSMLRVWWVYAYVIANITLYNNTCHKHLQFILHPKIKCLSLKKWRLRLSKRLVHLKMKCVFCIYPRVISKLYDFLLWNIKDDILKNVSVLCFFWVFFPPLFILKPIVIKTWMTWG